MVAMRTTIIIFFLNIIMVCLIRPVFANPEWYDEHNCYNVLCKQITGYYDSVNNATHIFIPKIVLAKGITEICIHVQEYPGIICGIDSIGRFIIPMPYFPQINVRLQFKEETVAYSLIYRLIKSNQSLAVMDNFIEPLWPQFGSVISGRLFIEFLHRMETKRECPNKFIALGLMNYIFMSHNVHITSSGGNVEPGSWFISLHPCFNEQEQKEKELQLQQQQKKDGMEIKSLNTMEVRKTNIPSYAYIEFIFSKHEIRKERKFILSNQMVSTLDQLKSLDKCGGDTCPVSKLPPNVPKKSSPRIHVCYWGSDVIDGQRRIWLNQMKYLDPKEFRFSYIITQKEMITSTTNHSKTLENMLLKLNNVEVYYSPFNKGISIPKELVVKEGLRDTNSPEYFAFLTKRVQIAKYKLKNITPDWVKHIYTIVYETIQPMDCDMIVYGNERDGVSDMFITDIAKILHFPSITELLSLFPNPIVTPNIIVGPSHYATYHSSVDHMISNITIPELKPQRFVISPGVDITKFNSSRVDLNPSRHQTYQEGSVVIGFLGRLSAEKSPGLFVMTAEILLRSNPTLRFLVIGDGILKESLIDLTNRLNISHTFDFVGWISNEELPNYLKAVDIVINPSLRSWSETFCISNIEVMSMGIPIVTFGVGGVGEYIEIPEDFEERSMNELVTIAKNAILVNEASPDAFSLGVELLLQDKLLYERISEAGRNTIIKRFYIEKQIEEYAWLYKYLSKNKSRS